MYEKENWAWYLKAKVWFCALVNGDLWLRRKQLWWSNMSRIFEWTTVYSMSCVKHWMIDFKGTSNSLNTTAHLFKCLNIHFLFFFFLSFFLFFFGLLGYCCSMKKIDQVVVVKEICKLFLPQKMHELKIFVKPSYHLFYTKTAYYRPSGIVFFFLFIIKFDMSCSTSATANISNPFDWWPKTLFPF